MGLIKISVDDVLKGAPWADGWYKATIESTETRESADKKSMNYIPHYRVEPKNEGEDARLIGGPGQTMFNSGAIGLMLPLLAAVANKHITQFREESKKNGVEFDFDGLRGSRLQIKITGKEFEGRMVYKVSEYLPYDDKVPF